MNLELDKCFDAVYWELQDLASVSFSDNYLNESVNLLKGTWLAARDQYERSALHMATMKGNVRLVRRLVRSLLILVVESI